MRVDPLLHCVLRDEGLTRGLGDAEARVLVEWLVEQTEYLVATTSAEEAGRQVRTLCRRGRAVAHFVRLWCGERSPGAAAQLAASERFNWPFPEGDIDACELMQSIVFWENQQAPLQSIPSRSQSG
jgi:hypothetical protein